jgi:hypothetical protein
VGDQTGLFMNAGVHCWAEFGAPNSGGSGNAVAVCVELAPCLSEMRHQPGWAMVAVTWTDTVCPGWKFVTTFDADWPVAASFPHGAIFWGVPSAACVHQLVGELSMKCASARAGAKTLNPPMETAKTTLSLGM